MNPDPSSRKVTMKDIAEKAGVSLMTVSRCLRNNPRQAEATRKHVQKIARDLGYSPHPYLSALMSNLAQTREKSPTANLAVLHFSPGGDLKPHRYFRGILERSAALGFSVETFLYSPDDIAPKRLREILFSRGVRGIILMPAPEGFSHIDFDFQGFAVSALGHTISNPVPRVASDIYTNWFTGFDELIRRGYQRIGLIQTDFVNRLGRLLHSAALGAYRDHLGTDCHFTEWIEPGDQIDLEKIRRIAEWIEREALDAVVSPVFDIPIYHLLLETGIRIPEDLGYLHLIDLPRYPEITQISQCPEFIGSKAVDMVVAAINRNEFEIPANPHTINISGKWMEGTTLPFRSAPPPPE